MSELISQIGTMDLRAVTGSESPIVLQEMATHNQRTLEKVLSLPGLSFVTRPGRYPVVYPDIAHVVGSILQTVPGVYFECEGLITDLSNRIDSVISLKNGYRTVLFGDSMTSQHYVDTTPSASYDPTTGVLTLTSLSNPVAEGWDGVVFNRSYAALKKHVGVTFTFVSSSSVSCYIGENLAGLPAGALAGTTFLRIPTKIGANGWFTWLQSSLGWSFDVVYNGAQSGDTTADCLARIDEHCISYQPEVVFMQLPGINDMSVGNGPINEETIFANQKAIITTILSAGAFLVLLSMTPVGTGEGRASLQNMVRVAQINRRLAEWTKSKNGVLFVDAYAAVVNPTDTTGLATAGLVKSTDQIHYSIPGAVKVADLVSAKVGPLFPSVLDTRPKSTIDCYANSAVTATGVTITGGVATFSATAHGFLAGEKVRITGATPAGLNGWQTVLSAVANSFTFATSQTGTVTGTVKAGRNRNLFGNPVLATATGGTVSLGVTGTAAALLHVKNTAGSAGGLTAVASVVAHSLYGNKQRLVCSAAVVDDRPGFEGTPTSLFNSDLVAGREYVLEAELSLASANWADTPISEIMCRFMANVGGTLFSSFGLNTYDGTPASGSITADRVIHIRTHPFLVPAGAITQGYFQIYVRAAGTWSSNLTLDLARVAVHDVTDE